MEATVQGLVVCLQNGTIVIIILGHFIAYPNPQLQSELCIWGWTCLVPTVIPHLNF